MEVDLGPPRQDSDGDSGIKRRRVTLACEQCRRRKIKCDATKPACGNCIKAEYACVYVPTKRSQIRTETGTPGETERGPRHPPGKRSHAERLDRIESLLNRLVSGKKRSHRRHGRSNSAYARDSSRAAGSDADFSDDGLDDAASDSESGDGSRNSDNSDNEVITPVGSSPVVDCVSTFDFVTRASAAMTSCSPLDSFQTTRKVNGPGGPGGGDEDVVIYNHGPFGTLTAPRNVRLWCELSGDRILGEKLIRAIRNTWKQQLMYIQHLSSLNSDSLVLDAPLVEFCFARYMSMKSPYFHSIFSPDDLRGLQSRSNWITAVRSGSPNAMIYCSVVICICTFMLLTGEHHHFAKDLLERQIEVACLVGLRSINLTPMVPPTFSLFRALVLFALTTSMMSTFAQVEHVLSVAYRIAVVIGLNREEFYMNLSPEEASHRRTVWWVCFCIDLTLSTYLAHAPVFDVDDISTPLPEREPYLEPIGASYLTLGVKLQRIYGRLYSRVFSVMGWRKSPESMLRTIIELDTELVNWYGEFESAATPPDRPVNENFAQQGTVDWMLIHMHHILGMEFQMITIQLYSLLLFSPLRRKLLSRAQRHLSSRLRHPLDTYTEAAEQCIEHSSHQDRQLNGFATCVSMTTGMVSLFIKHLVFPDHDRNQFDRKIIREAAMKFHRGAYMPLAIVTPLKESWMILVNALDLSVHRREVMALHQARKYQSDKPQSQSHPQSPATVQGQNQSPHGMSQSPQLEGAALGAPPVGPTPDIPGEADGRRLKKEPQAVIPTITTQMVYPQGLPSMLPQGAYMPSTTPPDLPAPYQNGQGKNGPVSSPVPQFRHQQGVEGPLPRGLHAPHPQGPPHSDPPYSQAPSPFAGTPARDQTPNSATSWQIPTLASPNTWEGNNQPSLILNADEVLTTELYPDLAMEQENVGLDRCTIC